jgi:hypothetical protein
VPRDLVVGEVLTVQPQNSGRRAGRAKAARDGEVDPAGVDVTHVVEIQRRGVADHALDLERPERRRRVLVQRAGGHVGEAENPAADRLEQPTLLHLLQSMAVYAKAARLAGGHVAVLLDCVLMEEAVDPKNLHLRGRAIGRWRAAG